MCHDTPLGILYGCIIGGVVGALFIAIPTVIENLPITRWICGAMDATASAAGKAARAVHNPDGKG